MLGLSRETDKVLRRMDGGKLMLKIVTAAGAALIALVALGPARADTFTAGDFTTYGPAEWGSNSTANNLWLSDFSTVYNAEGGDGTLVVGIGNSISFTGSDGLFNFLPGAGTTGALVQDYEDPTTTSSGAYGGEVVALRLNVDFSAAGFLPGTSGIPFGNLYLTGFDPALAGLNGMTVSQFLTLNETLLGGGSGIYTIFDIDLLDDQLNTAFDPSSDLSFADAHLTVTNPDLSATPLPSALPLFATSLGALGLLGRRRKRKNAAAIAGV
jgi:hypothetical protein